ncbi:hypothetical protein ACH6EH_03770 [Paenibacillus sp. JSM ZJ436]|uniref:hypothetical protein n=1 Tax=Paenibacillus sp. JSM ZJ436 TaxID=3376190 RepID=UPI00379BB38C
MKRENLFYIWVAITGYIAGMLTYIISLWVTSGRFFINLELLMTWTLVTFFTVGTSLFFSLRSALEGHPQILFLASNSSVYRRGDHSDYHGCIYDGLIQREQF